MGTAGSPAASSGSWLFDAADCAAGCASAIAGHIRGVRRIRGAVRTMAGGPGPGGHPGHRGRRQGRPGAFGDWPGGPGGPWRGWWPGPPGFARGPKASRGDVRAAILALLREGPRNGYQIMSEIETRSSGAWRPSPGAVYPALQQLADEGLVEAQESGGRRAFSLTEAGRRHIEENPETARAAWESMAASSAQEFPGLFAQAAQLAGSIVQMAHSGTPGQIRAAEALLEQTRRRMYQILATDDGSEQDDEQE